jgi:hypothetical protein
VNRVLSGVAALLMLCGCGSGERSMSTLHRYDRMRRELDWMTAASSHVSSDAGKLEIAMARSEVNGVRAAAVRLKLDARVYSLRAGAAGNTVRALASGAPSRQVRLYLLRVTEALSWQWVEGVALSSVADQAWADPMSVRGDDAQRLARDVEWAQTTARQAVRASTAARGIRQRAKAQFRYIVVTPAV